MIPYQHNPNGLTLALSSLDMNSVRHLQVYNGLPMTKFTADCCVFQRLITHLETNL